MSVVLRGFGLDQDSTSAIVAFGMSIDVQNIANPEVELENASIEQMFAIDYSGMHRPLTLAEWRQWKRIMAQVKAGQRVIQRRERRMNKLQLTFSRMLTPAKKAA